MNLMTGVAETLLPMAFSWPADLIKQFLSVHF